jgi:hypothetical protein
MDIDIKDFLKPKGISIKRNIDVRDSLGVVLNRIRLADLLEEYHEYRIKNDNKFVLTPKKYESIKLYRLEYLSEDGFVVVDGYYLNRKNAEEDKILLDNSRGHIKYGIISNIIETETID